MRQHPAVELAVHQSARIRQFGGCAGSQVICVLVLGVAGVTAHPLPLNLVRRCSANGFLPELQVLDRTAGSPPPAPGPAVHPARHAVYQVARVAGEHNAKQLAARRYGVECLDGGTERHAVVGGATFGHPEVPPHELLVLATILHQYSRTPRVRTLPSISEAALVGIDGNEGAPCRQVPVQRGAHPGAVSPRCVSLSSATQNNTSNESTSSRCTSTRSPVVGCTASSTSLPKLVRSRFGITTSSFPRLTRAIRIPSARARSRSSY